MEKKLYKMQRREIHGLPARLLRKEWENYADCTQLHDKKGAIFSPTAKCSNFSG